MHRLNIAKTSVVGGSNEKTLLNILFHIIYSKMQKSMNFKLEQRGIGPTYFRGNKSGGGRGLGIFVSHRPKSRKGGGGRVV